MDWAGALRARLTGDAGVAAVVGSAVFWAFVKQGTALPYIRLQVISDVRDEHLKGYDGARRTRVQCDCFADKHLAAQELAEAVIAALAAPADQDGVRFGRTSAEGPRDLGEDVEGTGFIHRASVDLLVEHMAL